MNETFIKGQTAIVTGASSGIGKAVANHFASYGVNVIVTARRMERLAEVANELSSKYPVKVTPLKLDVQNKAEVEQILGSLEIPVDILVNNAGLALGSDKIQEGNIEYWETMIDTNVKGLLYVTKALLPKMIKRNKGHIFNIGSIAGHECYISGNVYCATKFAVRSLSKSLRLDLLGTALRVTEIAPGAVETEFSEVRWKDKERAKQFYKGFEPLVAQDIADAILYCATRPPHVNVAEMVIFPQAQASASNIYREGDSVRSAFDTSTQNSNKK